MDILIVVGYNNLILSPFSPNSIAIGCHVGAHASGGAPARRCLMGFTKQETWGAPRFAKPQKRSCNSHSNSSTWLWIGALIGEVKSCNHWIGWSYLRLKLCFWPPNWSGFPAQTSGRKDPYDLNALHAIDDKLAQLVPESEWEALPVEGSERDRSLCFSSQETL